MVGGTTSGYSLIGNLSIASRPSRKISMERTPAKIGRLMKKCEKFMMTRVELSSYVVPELFTAGQLGCQVPGCWPLQTGVSPAFQAALVAGRSRRCGRPAANRI